MKKSIVTMLISTILVLAMSFTSFAAGSITTGTVDMGQTSFENGNGSLTSSEGVTYAQDVQAVVDAIHAVLNSSEGQSTTLEDAVGSLIVDEVEHYHFGTLLDSNVDLSKYKFLSRVMELVITDGTPSFATPVTVTMTVNNLTNEMDADVLHYCDEHGWEILTGVEKGNQLTVEFHSFSPVAVIYKDKPKPSGGGGWTSPSFWPTATPAPTAASVVAPVEKEDVVVEESDVYEESSEESVVESVVESSEESVVSSSEESDVPAGAEAEGSGSVLPIVLVAAALVAIGIFLIVFLKRKKDEE